MLISRYKFLLLVVFNLYIGCILANDNINTRTEGLSVKNTNYNCNDSLDKKILRGGWYLWEPYQFNRLTTGGYNLVGMDIELVKNIAHLVGVSIETEPVNWQQHQQDLKDGTRDIASGATYTDARAEYVYFSVPYRYEENSLFMMNNSDKELSFKSISEFLAQVRLQNFVLGITKGFIYADPQINLFIKEEANNDIIVCL